jgi:catechol 2,3-dioxygenase-like lactoylglutathione lyase family enzyme
MQACAQAHQNSGLKGKTMKRLHVHIAVNDIQQSIGFYSALFAAQPAVVKTDYAKWMLDDPRVNLAISTRGREPGLDHLGIQVENAGELNEVYARLREAGGNIIEQGETACCYAKSEKSWIDDPAGIAWETFLTTGESTTYGDGTGENGARVAHDKQSACSVSGASPSKPASTCC